MKKKITHSLKPRDTMDAYPMSYGSAASNVYIGTFGILPSVASITIDNPIKKSYVADWAQKEGFTIEILGTSRSQQRFPLGNRAPAQYDEDNIVFCHQEKMIILISNHSYGERVDITMLCPAEEWDYVNKCLEQIRKEVGSATITGSINLLGFSDGEFILMPLSVTKPDMDLALNYGSEFLETHKTIKALIDSTQSGLILLHGTTGSGKSTYIYHLIQECGKRMIYIPNNLIGKIVDPEFVSFLITNAKNSVIVVEDAEKVLLKRGGGGDGGVSTLLNLTDGVLGRVLMCKVICTFNIERTEIDPALLRKGRLQLEHKFQALDASQANKLLEHLGKTRRTNEPLTLAEIYNEEGGVETTLGVIGFTK